MRWTHFGGNAQQNAYETSELTNLCRNLGKLSSKPLTFSVCVAIYLASSSSSVFSSINFLSFIKELMSLTLYLHI